jgi:hypothetical protein
MPVKIVSIAGIRTYAARTVQERCQSIVSFVPPAMRTVLILFWNSVLHDFGFLISVMVVMLWVNVLYLKT